MAEGRSMTEMLGGMGNPSVPTGQRHTPGYAGAPNAEPLGAETGAPPHTRCNNMQILPFSAVGLAGRQATMIAPETRDNRVAYLTPPLVGFTIYVGDAGVSPQSGMALLPGQINAVPLPGFQALYAVTDAPVFLTLQIQIASILLAERERRL